MFEAKTYLQSLERTQKREVDLTENLKQHETFKRLVEHSTRVSRGDWLFRKQNVDEKIREEIRMEEMLRKKEEREEKEAMKRREEELEELEEKRRRNGGSGGNGGVSAFSPEDDPLPSSADETYLREMKEKLDALRSEREQEMTKEMKRREREEERRRMRGLTESRDVVGRAVDEEDYERKKREIEKLTRALDVRLDLNRQTEKRRAMEREREEEKKKEREFADNFERERVRRERDLLNRKRKEARELRQ